MMSPSAQALYFHIGMNADDDGFCEVFTIVRMTESKPDDLRSLHERGLIYIIDSRVCIVKDWHTNNDIRVDRYTRSKHLDDSNYSETYMIIMKEKIKHLSKYKLNNKNPGITSGITSGITQVRIGKDRLDKNIYTKPFLDFLLYWNKHWSKGYQKNPKLGFKPNKDMEKNFHHWAKVYNIAQIKLAARLANEYDPFWRDEAKVNPMMFLRKQNKDHIGALLAKYVDRINQDELLQEMEKHDNTRTS